MKRLLAMMIVLGAASAALSWPTPALQAAQTPHPAVVRVTALERGGASLGSGELVAVDQTYGLVLTNWHVVRDATGPILVSFPDGFTSGAVVLKTDSTWDLAALGIWRPNVQPVPVATQPARPGEVLTIAGYGRDSYRAIAGRCTEYLSPGGNNPNEIVELDVAARSGDSGGPIFNSRGELAGVLFGANDSFFSGQYTMGSYCGRVRRFLAEASGDFQRLPGNPTMLAQRTTPAANPAPPAAIMASQLPPPPSYLQTQPAPLYRQTEPAAETAASVSPGLPGRAPSGSPSGTTGQVCATGQAGQQAPCSSGAPPNRAEQIKTILAAIGIFALLFHGIRLIGAAAG